MSQFFLRTNKTEGKAPLYVRTRRKGILFCVSTGIMVDVKEWMKAQTSLSAMQRYERTEEGVRVHDLQVEVMKAIDVLYAENKVQSKEDKSVIERAVSNVVNGTVEEIQQTAKVVAARTRSTVLGFYDYFFAGISDGSIRHGNNSDYSPGTVVVWKAFGENLRGYCKKDIPFDDIDKPFADKFTLYLMKQGYMPNTINKKVSCFRKLCNLAAMEGYNKNAVSLRVWKDRAVKEIEKRAEIYLTDEEIDAMYAMQLSGENEVVRDIFLLGYFSCQRYSDYCKLREENFITYNKSGLITLTQKKTGKKVEVPIYDDRVYELCDKYHYEFPSMDVQKMNLKIKAVGAELAETVPSFREKYVTVLTTAEKRAEKTYEKLLDKKTKGIKFTENERKWFHKLDKLAKMRNGSPLWERNKHGEVIRAKYELICSHTARRSGTTNLYKLGVLSDLELRSITGHESQKNFEGYIRIGISEQALRVGDKIKAAREAMKKQVDK